MSTFVKFPSLTNHYQAKWIQKVLEYYPALPHERCIVTEKLHGSCLQVYLTPDEYIRIGSRNRWLEPNCKFYDVWNALGKITPLLTAAGQWTERHQKSLRLFGELHGGNVQSGINYGPEQNIRFFAGMIDDRLISPDTLLNLGIAGLLQNFVPILSTSETFETAMAYDIDRRSVLTPADHAGPNLIEGVVIQPYGHVYRMPAGSTFILKKKDPARLVSPKKKRHSTPMEAAIVELRVWFLEYITEARVDSIISQNGPFTEIQQMGEYIKYVLEDAKTDFLFDHGEAMQYLDEKTFRYIFNVGGLVANMLKARL